MSRRLSNLSKRLAEVEKHLADRARREELADCNCPAMESPMIQLPAVFPEALEAELNETCPVHGLRRFGPIVVMDFVNLDGTSSENAIKCGQLIEAHELRLAQHSQSSIEPEQDDLQES